MIIQNDYIELPLLFKFTLRRNNEILQPYFFAGPNIGYLIISKIKVNGKLNGESSSETEDYEGNKDLDLGLNAGGGIKYKEFSIELRYQKGLQPILTDEASDGLEIMANFLSINLLIHMY
jgi:hypothetical protein